MPQTGHGLSGTNYATDGDGSPMTPAPIPNRYDQMALLFDWVEKSIAPGMSVVVTGDDRSLLLPRIPRIRGDGRSSRRRHFLPVHAGWRQAHSPRRQRSASGIVDAS